MKPSPVLPLLSAAGGVVVLCGMDATIKAMGAHLPTFEITIIRFFGSAIWLALYLAITGEGWPRPANFRKHAIRGALNAVTACMFFYALTNLPLAIVAALGMTAPIYISILGVLVFKETVSPWLFATVGLGLAGASTIVFGNGSAMAAANGNLLAWGCAVTAPLAYAFALVLMKRHATHEGAAAMTLSQSLVAGILIAPLAAVDFVPPPLSIWWLVVLCGFLGAAGFILLINGLRRLPASIFAVVDYTGLLWAAFYGFVFFREVPGPSVWIGGAMIISACALSMHMARKPALA